MEFVGILQAIFGIILIFFLPGFMFLRLFYKKILGLEMTVLGIGLSIAASIFIGLILGLFKIFNYTNSLISYAILIVIILIAYFIKKRYR